MALELPIGPALEEFLAREAPGGRVAIDPDRVEQDLARLLLCLMEFLRQVMETQAVFRVEQGSLTAAQEEAVGTALMRAEAKIRDLAAQFEIPEEALRLSLGPIQVL